MNVSENVVKFPNTLSYCVKVTTLSQIVIYVKCADSFNSRLIERRPKVLSGIQVFQIEQLRFKDLFERNLLPYTTFSEFSFS